MKIGVTIELTDKEFNFLNKLTLVDDEGMFEANFEDFEMDELYVYNGLIKKGIIIEYEEYFMKFQSLTTIGLIIYKQIK